MLMYFSKEELDSLYKAVVVFANSEFYKNENDEKLINKITAEQFACYN